MPISDTHSPYSDQAQETWRIFYRTFFAHMRRFEHLLHPAYKNNLHILHDFADRIPSLAAIKHLLAPFGWTARYVDGYAPPWRIAQMLARQVMPVSRAIRPPEEVHFAREPDLIHDLFGHLPSLLDSDYRRLLLRWAKGAVLESVTEMDRTHYHLNKVLVQTRDRVPDKDFDRLQTAAQALAAFSSAHPSRLFLQDKIYFWIFEFGMIESCGDKQIFGAGILSSLSELTKIATQPVTTIRLSPESYQTHYDISGEQSTYLVMSRMGDYDDFLYHMQKKPQLSQAVTAGLPEAMYA